MISAPVVNGTFRGICVDNRDPRNLGRIRVQVPQILGTSASGWAFPAWAQHQTMLWPEDRLPKPGDGVWVTFDSTSPDKMIWGAAFGPLPLVNQPEVVDRPNFETFLTLTKDVTTVEWNKPVVLSGVLTSDMGGTPNPDPTVEVRVRLAGGNWQVIGETRVNTDGTWSLTHLVQLTGSVEFVAEFAGVGVYGRSVSNTIAASVAVVTFPTALTMEIVNPSSAALNGKTTFRGTLLADTAPGGYVIPKNAVLSFTHRPSGGQFTTVSSTIPVNPVTGEWSFVHTISIAGAAQYRATYLPAGIWLGSQSPILDLNTSVAVTVSTPTLPSTLTRGSAMTVSGTVTATGGAQVNEGEIQLWWRIPTGNWAMVTQTSTVSAGNYVLTHSSLPEIGPIEWQVRYVGTTKFNAANSAVVTGTVNLPAHGPLTKGAITHSSAAFSWSAVTGATSYDVERWNGSAWVAANGGTGITATSYSATGLSNNTTYNWRVRPKANSPGGVTMFGAASSTIGMSTGQPAVAATVNNRSFTFDTNTFRCYRNDTGWQGSSDYEMRQSWFSSSYGGKGYVGIAVYSGIKSAIVAVTGASGLSSGSCQGCEITLYRTGTGTDSGADPSFYTTTSKGTGGRPTLLGSAVTVASSGYNSSKTYSIGTAHGARLAKEEAFSVAIARDTANQYLGLNGSGTNGGRLVIDWRWSSGGQPLVSPAWL